MIEILEPDLTFTFPSSTVSQLRGAAPLVLELAGLVGRGDGIQAVPVPGLQVFLLCFVLQMSHPSDFTLHVHHYQLPKRPSQANTHLLQDVKFKAAAPVLAQVRTSF